MLTARGQRSRFLGAGHRPGLPRRAVVRADANRLTIPGKYDVAGR